MNDLDCCKRGAAALPLSYSQRVAQSLRPPHRAACLLAELATPLHLWCITVSAGVSRLLTVPSVRLVRSSWLPCAASTCSALRYLFTICIYCIKLGLNRLQESLHQVFGLFAVVQPVNIFVALEPGSLTFSQV